MMDASNVIFEEVQSLIAETLAVPSERVLADTKISDLSEDSIQLFELLLAFERKYATETTYEDVVQLKTVGDIALYVERIVYAAK